LNTAQMGIWPCKNVAVATKDAGFAIKHVHLTINNRD